MEKERKEVEVTIRFDKGKINMQRLWKIEELFIELGIGFDTGGTCDKDGIRDWEWDWSLKGPVKVFFRRFVEDNPKNRYARSKKET